MLTFVLDAVSDQIDDVDVATDRLHCLHLPDEILDFYVSGATCNFRKVKLTDLFTSLH